MYIRVDNKIMKLIYFTLSLILISSVGYGQDHHAVIKNTYYPVDSFLDSKQVYSYKVIRNFYPISRLYLVFWVEIQDQDTILYQESYNQQKIADQIWKIKIHHKGIELLEQHSYSTTKSKIIRSDIIPWDLEVKQNYKWIIANNERILKRIRQSSSVSDSIRFQKRMYYCIESIDKIQIKEYQAVGSPEKRNLIRTSYYLEGIGLYKSIQKYPDVFITFELEEILDYESWKKN
jgi:hypothetical protein